MIEYFTVLGQIVLLIIGSAIGLVLIALGIALIVLVVATAVSVFCLLLHKEPPRWIEYLDEMIIS